MLFATENISKAIKVTSYLRVDVILRTATTKNWNKFLPVVVEVPYLNRRTATNQALDDRRIPAVIARSISSPPCALSAHTTNGDSMRSAGLTPLL